MLRNDVHSSYFPENVVELYEVILNNHLPDSLPKLTECLLAYEASFEVHVPAEPTEKELFSINISKVVVIVKYLLLKDALSSS